MEMDIFCRHCQKKMESLANQKWSLGKILCDTIHQRKMLRSGFK